MLPQGKRSRCTCHFQPHDPDAAAMVLGVNKGRQAVSVAPGTTHYSAEVT